MHEVRPSHRGGRGLFATQRIRANSLLMEAPLLLIPGDHREALRSTIVDDYVYEWEEDGTAALVLGVSSMCNHSDTPNAYLWLVPDTSTAELWSLSAIRRDDEITVSYRADGTDAPLWFDIVDD